MKFHTERWGWVVLLAAGCADVASLEGGTAAERAAVTQGSAAPANAPAAAVTGTPAAAAAVSGSPAAAPATGVTRVYRSHPQPADRQHPTGLREMTPEQRQALQEATPKLTEIRPTPLALDRIKQHVGAQKTRASAELSALEGQVAGPGTDLVTSAPGEKSTLKAAAAATLPRSVDNSTLAAFPEIRDQGGIGSCVGFAVG